MIFFIGGLGYCSLALFSHTVSPLSLCPFPSLGLSSALVGSVVTPLVHSEFRRELATHPDQARVNYVCNGLQYGFHVGFSPELASLRSSTRNLKSAGEHPVVVDKYLQNEIEKCRVAGPFVAPPLPNLHCSPFGVIPKKNQPGKWNTAEKRLRMRQPYL